MAGYDCIQPCPSCDAELYSKCSEEVACMFKLDCGHFCSVDSVIKVDDSCIFCPECDSPVINHPYFIPISRRKKWAREMTTPSGSDSALKNILPGVKKSNRIGDAYAKISSDQTGTETTKQRLSLKPVVSATSKQLSSETHQTKTSSRVNSASHLESSSQSKSKTVTVSETQSTKSKNLEPLSLRPNGQLTGVSNTLKEATNSAAPPFNPSNTKKKRNRKKNKTKRTDISQSVLPGTQVGYQQPPNKNMNPTTEQPKPLLTHQPAPNVQYTTPRPNLSLQQSNKPNWVEKSNRQPNVYNQPPFLGQPAHTHSLYNSDPRHAPDFRSADDPRYSVPMNTLPPQFISGAYYYNPTTTTQYPLPSYAHQPSQQPVSQPPLPKVNTRKNGQSFARIISDSLDLLL